LTLRISAVLPAAGKSQRMGKPKQLLSWGRTTILGQVVRTFANSLSAEFGQDYEILVITGAWRDAVESEVANLSEFFPVKAVYNPGFDEGGMLRSIQTGITALTDGEAALVGLADQPQVEVETIRNICQTYLRHRSPLVIPSYNNHRGHPWLVARSLWPDILSLSAVSTARDFLRNHKSEILYINATSSVLQDLDTPNDYEIQRPKG
jgi:molybdenum cofactor cytidylyltransferase